MHPFHCRRSPCWYVASSSWPRLWPRLSLEVPWPTSEVISAWSTGSSGCCTRLLQRQTASDLQCTGWWSWGKIPEAERSKVFFYSLDYGQMRIKIYSRTASPRDFSQVYFGHLTWRFPVRLRAILSKCHFLTDGRLWPGTRLETTTFWLWSWQACLFSRAW